MLAPEAARLPALLGLGEGDARPQHPPGTHSLPTALVLFSLLKAFDHILAAVEDIVGHHGYHYWRDK